MELGTVNVLIRFCTILVGKSVLVGSIIIFYVAVSFPPNEAPTQSVSFDASLQNIVPNKKKRKHQACMKGN